MWAIVPFRGVSDAKRRLAHKLTAAERSSLALAMLDDVLSALVGAACFDGIVLVSTSPKGAELARRKHIDIYRENATTLVDALIEASDWLKSSVDAETTFIVPGDVPAISPTEVRQIVTQHDEISIIPDRVSVGTNGLICTPPNAFPYVFDGKSYHPHMHAAHIAGYRPKTIRSEQFGLDVDTLVDLLEVATFAPQSKTSQYLFNSGTYQRIATNPEGSIAS